MVQTVEAIFEGGVLRPLAALSLSEMQRVRVVVESVDAPTPEPDAPGDPLAGLRSDLGVADFAENFDDYRFGRRTL